MLGFSQTVGYAIQALGCLNDPTCARHQTADIARCAKVPKPYLYKIIQALARKRLVVAKRGIGGGVALARPPAQISLLRIVEAVEGKNWLSDCLLGLNECSNQKTCPTHDFWQRIRREITEELDRTTLATVIAFRTQSRAQRRQGPPRRR